MLVTVIIIVVVLLALAAVGGYFYRGQRLRKRFGPEYDRMVQDSGSRFRAEQELRGREKRHDGLTLRELPAEARNRYTEEWRQVQALFVDDPRRAATQADALITRIMTDRGYPTGQFDQRAADLSVEHATTVDRYRRAHELTISHHQGDADTEDLRHALVDYRALVADLLGTDPIPTHPDTTDTAEPADTTATGTDAGTRESAVTGEPIATDETTEPREAALTGETRETSTTGETVGTGETGDVAEPVHEDTHRPHLEAR